LSVQVSYKKQSLFFIILILMTLIITEGVVRTFDIKEVHCAFIEHEYFKNYNMFEKQDMCEKYNSLKFDYTQPIRLLIPDQHNNYFNINSDGFRGSELDLQENDYKIFILGGSTTYGFITSSDEFTIPSLLEKEIGDVGVNIKVVNAGIPTANSSDELYYLENYILNYSPNMIIVYDGWNDIMQGREDFAKEKLNNNDVLINYKIENVIDDNTRTGLISFFAKIDYQTGLGIALFLSHLINEPEIDLTKNIDIYEKTETKALDFIESRLENNWSEICSLGEKHEFKTVNIIHPALGTSDREISNATRSLLSDFNVYMKKLNLDHSKINSCENIFDFRNIFAGMDNEIIYWDGVHMSDNENKIIAEKISEKIRPIILEDLN